VEPVWDTKGQPETGKKKTKGGDNKSFGATDPEKKREKGKGLSFREGSRVE